MRECGASELVGSSLLEIRVGAAESRVGESEVPAWPPGATPDFAAVGADGLVVPMEVPICLPESVFVESERVAVSLPELDSEGVLAVIELPIRDVMLRLMRLFAAASELLPELDVEGPLAVISAWGRLGPELPMRDVVLRLIPLLRLVPGELVEFDTDGVLAVIGLPMVEVSPELMRPEELLGEGLRETTGGALGVPTDDLALGDLEDTDGLLADTGAREVMVVLGREGIDGLGATVRTELLRLDEITGRELAGG